MIDDIFPELAGADRYLATFISRISKTVEDPDLPAIAGVTMVKGKLILLYHPAFRELPDRLKRELLKHEAGHWIFNSHDRLGEKNFETWAKATDLVINQTVADSKVLDEIYEVFTFERFNFPIVSAEVAYNMLLEKNSPNGNGKGCAHAHGLKYSDDSKASLIERVLLEGDIAANLPEFLRNGASTTGSGSGVEIEVKVFPNWLKRLIPKLRKACGETVLQRDRSYARESRRDVDLKNVVLPGRVGIPGSRVQLQIMIDQSGSMDPSHLGMFLGAISVCPEIRNAAVYCFDMEASPKMEAKMEVVKEYLENHAGGGTMITNSAKVLDPSIPVVYFTDAYSGDGLPTHKAEEFWVVPESSRHEVRGKQNVITFTER